MSKIIIDESPEVFFNKLVQDALTRTRTNVSDRAVIYVTHALVLYASPVRSPSAMFVPLAPAYLSALTEAINRAESEQNFRSIGDTTLLLTGFWWQYIYNDKNPKYHIELGRRAYSHIQKEPFPELAERFEKLVNLLMEVSSQCHEYTDSDILKIYTAWSETRNSFLSRLLTELGVIPTASGKLNN